MKQISNRGGAHLATIHILHHVQVEQTTGSRGVRRFAIADSIVLGQLHELEQLAEQDCRDWDYHLVDILIRAVIGTMKVLPEEISARIRTSFYVGSAHYDTTNSGRMKLWARLSAGLNEDMDRLSADTTLADIDVSKRSRTRGEAILAACERLDSLLPVPWTGG